VVLYATTPDNSEASGHEFAFTKFLNLDPLPPDPGAVALIARYDGTSWSAYESVASGDILELALALKAFVGEVPPFRAAILQGVGAAFDDVQKISVDDVEVMRFRALSFVAGEFSYLKTFFDVEFDEAHNLDADSEDPDVLLRKSSWYFLYGMPNGDLKWSLVPPTLGSKSAWVFSRTTSFSVDTSFSIVSANQSMSVKIGDDIYAASIPTGTYNIRSLSEAIMNDDNWNEGVSPVRAFDIGDDGDGTIRRLAMHASGLPGEDQTLELVDVNNSIYSTVGWTDFVEVERAGEASSFILSAFSLSDLTLRPARSSAMGETMFESQAVGDTTSSLKAYVRAGAFDGSETVDLSDFVPPGAAYANVLVDAASPCDFSILARGVQADVLFEDKDTWSGKIAVPRGRRISVTSSIAVNNTLRIFIAGYN